MNPLLYFVDKYSSSVFKDGRWPRLMRIHVHGIEVTQGIQYFHADEHLTDPADRGPDNSVELVRGKAAWVRVYVRPWFGTVNNVTGRLRVERAATPWGAGWSQVAMLSPLAPGVSTVDAAPAYATERGTIGRTLNFVIPAEEMSGRLRLTALVWTGTGSESNPESQDSVEVNVTLRQTLRLRGILISYNGANAAGNGTLNLAAPTVADLTATAGWSLRCMPVEAQGSFSSGGSMTWSTPLTGVATVPGGCSTQWLALNAAVAQARILDGNREGFIYYGLLPVGVPIANVGGCESSGVSTGSNTADVTMAHEIGHGCGLQHGPCGTPGDPNYPAYEPYDPANNPTSSLGEYGLDIVSGTVHPPGEKDLMSYCGGNWFSLYHYGRLTNNARLNPQRLKPWRPPILVDPYLWPWELWDPNPPDPWEEQFRIRPGMPQPLVSVVALVEDGRVTVQSVARVSASPVLAEGSSTDLELHLLGSEAAPIAATRFMRLPAQGGGCGCGGSDGEPPRSYVVQALLPTDKLGEALRIVRRSPDKDERTTVWEVRAPERAPEIGEFEVRTTENGRATARWSAHAGSSETLVFDLQFSKDGGRSWNGVANGLTGSDYEFDLEHLPAGELVFRLLAHDGFQTVVRDSQPIQLPERPPMLTILSPRAGETFEAGAPVPLWAAIDSRDGRPPDGERLRWEVDGELIGHGLQRWAEGVDPGRHEATASFDAPEGPVRASVTFECRGPHPTTSRRDR